MSSTIGQLEVRRRFNGPPGSGNGGYLCGLLASHLDGEAEVTLRAPPPLERPLAVRRTAGGVQLCDGGELVADARTASLPEPAAPAVGLEEARRASTAGYERWAARHPFPTCFVCGPERGKGDGLRVFPGALGREGLFAAPWTPDGSVAAADGTVRPECVWAALDCPTSAPVANYGEGPPIVLARLAARLDTPVVAGRAHVLVSWALGREGRKRSAAAALTDARGRVLAHARALWIELRRG